VIHSLTSAPVLFMGLPFLLWFVVGVWLRK
jgi:hypothetical protein